MDAAFAFIGFGEAGAAFAGGAPARGYDRKTDDPSLRAAKLGDFERAGVRACDDAREALADLPAALSLVTADQALAAAQTAGPLLARGALWFDMNSVAPDTKRTAAAAIEAAGGRYVDVAVMSPVHPARRGAPLLISGPHAAEGVTFLAGIGFTNATTVPGPVGAASSIKMIRSVMVKGLEALTAECALAAYAAGVEAEVIASLDACWPGADWAKRFDYNLDRMLVHGRRRAEEMSEVTQTLLGLGISPIMSEGAVSWQQAMGELGVTPAEGLSAKIEAIQSRMRAVGA